jgi:ABC-2 type transport system ATP-binding protein
VAEAVIDVRGLHKSYGSAAAVRGIDLRVEAGECFAFLGPNGAGKTTTVEILEGYRPRTAGDVHVLGVDPAHPTRQWRERVGIVLQTCKVAPELTVGETVAQYAGYYAGARSVEETIEVVGLGEAVGTRAGKLSGGQQRRLDVALALVGDPDLLFLDEPTTGFDPSARRAAWDVVANLTSLGKTVFLTTHYMDEAQALADRIALIAGGVVVAEGTPHDIGGRAGADSVVTFRLDGDDAALPPSLSLSPSGLDGRWRITTPEPVRVLHELTGWALDRGVGISELTVERPTLEDVYLALTAGA